MGDCKLNEKLLVFTKGLAVKNISARDINVFAEASTPFVAAGIVVTQDGVALNFTAGQKVIGMNSFVANDVEAAMGDLKITIPDVKAVIDRMLLLERYVLT